MKRLVSLLLAFIAYLGMGFPRTLVYANEQISYTNVIEDLEKDNSFKLEDYPSVEDDYSLQVIQIAESVNGELFVYVYQPSDAAKDLTATTIRMAMPEVGVDCEWRDYDLILLSTQGVFDKYLVGGIVVKDAPVRYYDITAIHRKFDASIDTPTDSNYEQTIDEIVYEVGDLCTAATTDNGVTYTHTTSETIEVTAKLVGYIQYPDGYEHIHLEAFTDSHFVAFSTDRTIDKLLEADVTFVEQSYSKAYGYHTQAKYGEPKNGFVTVSHDEKTGNNGSGLFGKAYTWSRIQTGADFIAENTEDLNLTDGDISSLKDMDWVLRFYETPYTEEINLLGSYMVEGTCVSEVSILRLKFKTDGKVYNLGVVDNKQTGSKDPFASADDLLDDLGESRPNWTVLIAVLALCLLFPILYPLVSALIEFFIWLVTTPFKAIKRRGNDKDG